MRKFVYLCCLTMMSLSMAAQIDLSDLRNWSIILNENFEGSGRGWNSYFNETGVSNPIWCCHYHGNKYSVTRGPDRYQISQKSQCRFNDGVNFNDDKLRIICDFRNDTNYSCGMYKIPEGTVPGTHTHYGCDPDLNHLYYFSGNIETLTKFTYGYFEIRSKTPVHRGAWTGMWLFGSGSRRYEEIDVNEYHWPVIDPTTGTHTEYVYGSGIFYGPTQDEREIYGFKPVRVPTNSGDLNHWHTFGLEWLPGRVIWYLDGEVVNEFYEQEHIPWGPMELKVGYSIDKEALDNQSLTPVWRGHDTLVIDHIRVYQLKADCEEDLVVTRSTQLDSIDAMKRTITIGAPNNAIVVPVTTRQTLRATEITINSGFEVPIGAQFALITHPCPCAVETKEESTNYGDIKNNQIGTKTEKP